MSKTRSKKLQLPDTISDNDFETTLSAVRLLTDKQLDKLSMEVFAEFTEREGTGFNSLPPLDDDLPPWHDENEHE